MPRTGRALKRSPSGRKINARSTASTGELGVGYFAAENKDIVTILRGQWVAIHSSGSGVVLANASNNQKPAIGMMSADTNVGATQNVVTDEVFTLTDWGNVAGAAALQGGANYFLDTRSGYMTTTAPAIHNQVAQRVGRAISTTQFDIEVEEAILL